MSYIRTPQVPPRDKKVCVEFLGGEMNGLTVNSWSGASMERQIVELVWILTRGGTTNRGIQGVPFTTIIEQYMGSRDGEALSGVRSFSRYHVKERLDNGDDILIRLEYSQRCEGEPPARSLSEP